MKINIYMICMIYYNFIILNNNPINRKLSNSKTKYQDAKLKQIKSEIKYQNILMEDEYFKDLKNKYFKNKLKLEENKLQNKGNWQENNVRINDFLVFFDKIKSNIPKDKFISNLQNILDNEYIWIKTEKSNNNKLKYLYICIPIFWILAVTLLILIDKKKVPNS